MSMVNRAGTFTAFARSATVTKSSKSISLFVVVDYETMHEKTPQGWAEAPGMTIKGWHTIVNSDGAVNEMGVKALHDALGWDGSLNSVGVTFPAAEAKCQIVLEMSRNPETGKDGLKVKWLNPYDSQGGGGAIKNELDDTGRRQAAATYDGLFKAAIGAASKPAGAPAAVPPRQSPRQEPPPQARADNLLDQAKATF